MKPQVLFEALAEIAGEHEQNPSDDLLVVPVLTDELETRRDLLGEVAEFLGGTLLDVSSGLYDQPIGAYDDPALRGAVGAGLSFQHPGGGRSEISLSMVDGKIESTLRSRGRVVTVPSPAETQLLAISRALFVERLAEDELAILLYDEKLFDDDTQAAVLNMLTGLGRQARIRLGGVRTLVPLIRSTGLDRARHCQLHRGVRYSLNGRELVRRHVASHLDDTIRKLIVPRPQPLVLFLGAGFSASSNMPVGNSVRNDTIRRICQIADDGHSDEQLAATLFRFATAPGRSLLTNDEIELGEDRFANSVTLEQVVRIEKELFEESVPRTIQSLRQHHNNIIGDSSTRFGDAVYALHRLIQQKRNLILVTVNFDELAEHGQNDAVDIAVEDSEFAALVPILSGMKSGGKHPEGKIPLLKLHGTINSPETCVAADDQTKSGISPQKAQALMALVTDLSAEQRLPWVYVGASMRDIDLNRIFGANEFNDFVSERWVAPWPEASVQRFIDSQNRWWKALGQSLFDRTVTETADAFVSVLAEMWEREAPTS